MIHAIRAISSYSDPEYQRIIQELRKLGITPSGDPGIDRTKLNQEKAELLKKFNPKKVSFKDNKTDEVDPIQSNTSSNLFLNNDDAIVVNLKKDNNN